MDLDEAVQVHAEWKVKLRTAITKKETLDPKVLGADNQCKLGKWLHGEGKAAYGKLPSFAQCTKAHADFHRTVGEVASTIVAKKFEQASSMLDAGTPFAKSSTAVGIALAGLKKEAKL